MLGTSEHTCKAIIAKKLFNATFLGLANHFFDNEFQNQELVDSNEELSDNESGWDPGMPARISGVISDLRNRTLQPRRQLRPRVGGFDPVELGALARVQNMRAPGFRRQPTPPPTSARRTNRLRISNNSTAPTPPISGMQTRRQSGTVDITTSDDADQPDQNAPAPERPPVRRSLRLAANLL